MRAYASRGRTEAASRPQRLVQPRSDGRRRSAPGRPRRPSCRSARSSTISSDDSARPAARQRRRHAVKLDDVRNLARHAPPAAPTCDLSIDAQLLHHRPRRRRRRPPAAPQASRPGRPRPARCRPGRRPGSRPSGTPAGTRTPASVSRCEAAEKSPSPDACPNTPAPPARAGHAAVATGRPVVLGRAPHVEHGREPVRAAEPVDALLAPARQPRHRRPPGSATRARPRAACRAPAGRRPRSPDALTTGRAALAARPAGR